MYLKKKVYFSIVLKPKSNQGIGKMKETIDGKIVIETFITFKLY